MSDYSSSIRVRVPDQIRMALDAQAWRDRVGLSEVVRGCLLRALETGHLPQPSPNYPIQPDRRERREPVAA